MPLLLLPSAFRPNTPGHYYKAIGIFLCQNQEMIPTFFVLTSSPFDLDWNSPLWLIAVFVCLGWGISLCLHEFGHALVAYWGGDKSVKDKGYLTLNPLKYTDPGLSLIMPLFFLLIGGIALPGGAVYINHNKLRNRWWKSAVSLAGPLADAILAVLLALPFQLGLTLALGQQNEMLVMLFFASLAFVVLLNVYVVLINLLPIPPLDGYGIIEPWLPEKLQQQLDPIGRFGIWILIGLLWFVEPFNRFLWNITYSVSQFLGVPTDLAMLAGSVFRQYSIFVVVGLILVFLVFKRGKTDAPSLYRRGVQLAEAQRPQEAIAAFDQAIAQQSDFYPAWYMRGAMLAQLQQYDEAIASFDKVLADDPENSDVWFVQGQILAQAKRYEEAVEAYGNALNSKPGDGEIWNYLSGAFIQLQRFEDAIVASDRAIQLKPDYATAWNNRGIAHMGLQQYDQAIAAYEQALNLDPNYAEVWYNKACCYALQSKTEMAVQSLKQAIQLKPDRFRQLAQTDSDFAAIREQLAFQELLNG
jgi:tetratricopeptide (TPR) repeat protein